MNFNWFSLEQFISVLSGMERETSWNVYYFHSSFNHTNIRSTPSMRDEKAFTESVYPCNSFNLQRSVRFYFNPCVHDSFIISIRERFTIGWVCDAFMNLWVSECIRVLSCCREISWKTNPDLIVVIYFGLIWESEYFWDEIWDEIWLMMSSVIRERWRKLGICEMRC